MKYTLSFSEINIKDVGLVGGKNASLGEMYMNLNSLGIKVPNGFAVTAKGYWAFIHHNNLFESLQHILDELNIHNFHNLSEVGEKARKLILNGEFPNDLKVEIISAYHKLNKESGDNKSYAVRSSATAEDLPNASFAGQQETFLNVSGDVQLLDSCRKCFASLFKDRAIKYRIDQGFEHMKVGLSVGVQLMVRSDLSSSGVMFTIDPDSGFKNAVLISGAWGLGENVVQGSVNTDEFLVFKPTLETAKQPIISRKMGSKLKTMVFNSYLNNGYPGMYGSILNTDTPPEKQNSWILKDEEVIQISKWGVIIENYYKRPMDIEWAKDGADGQIYIVQARPETVHQNKAIDSYTEYTLKNTSKVICKGSGIGNRIVSGKARLLISPSEIDLLKEGEILITERTDPDWDPILKKASGIITNQGGRTSHAAIVARELGATAIIGTGNATKLIKNGEEITLVVSNGGNGDVYEGILKWNEKTISLNNQVKPHTKAMLILAHPDDAFKHALLPNDGVGLLRMEFIINNTIGIHPMALINYPNLKKKETIKKIEGLTFAYKNKSDYFVQSLSESIAKIAAAFFPKDVIVRLSDFKSNEYANLIGGEEFEPVEENPMIGLRGASRYYHPLYKEAFKLECKALKQVRETMRFKNVKIMVPFCRTIQEAVKVLELMKECGLERGKEDLEVYVMIEIPSNAILAEEFAKHFDGFSIGSNDLTQLTLGADRDSELLSEVFSPFDPAVMKLIEMTIEKAKKSKKPVGLCGQAPSDYPEYAQFLIKHGINSISFNPDAIIKGIENILIAEKKSLKNNLK
jgi:pyruvate,water dikinase